ncbi:MAG: hypothetical protein ACI9VN_000347 [Patescibacteria group bacterium]|jgi:hypothetical protein
MGNSYMPQLDDIYNSLEGQKALDLTTDELLEMIELAKEDLGKWVSSRNYIFEELYTLTKEVKEYSNEEGAKIEKENSDWEKIKLNFENAIYSYLFMGI